MKLFIIKNDMAGMVQAAKIHEVYKGEAKIVLLNTVVKEGWVIDQSLMNIIAFNAKEIYFINLYESDSSEYMPEVNKDVEIHVINGFIEEGELDIGSDLRDFITNGSKRDMSYEDVLDYLVYENIIMDVYFEYGNLNSEIVPFPKAVFMFEFINALHRYLHVQDLNSAKSSASKVGMKEIAKIIATETIMGEGASYFDMIHLREKIKGNIMEQDNVVLLISNNETRDIAGLAYALLIVYEVVLLQTNNTTVHVFTDGNISAGWIARYLFHGDGKETRGMGISYKHQEMLTDVNTLLCIQKETHRKC